MTLPDELRESLECVRPCAALVLCWRAGECHPSIWGVCQSISPAARNKPHGKRHVDAALQRGFASGVLPCGIPDELRESLECVRPRAALVLCWRAGECRPSIWASCQSISPAVRNKPHGKRHVDAALQRGFASGIHRMALSDEFREPAPSHRGKDEHPKARTPNPVRR